MNSNFQRVTLLALDYAGRWGKHLGPIQLSRLRLGAQIDPRGTLLSKDQMESVDENDVHPDPDRRDLL